MDFSRGVRITVTRDMDNLGKVLSPSGFQPVFSNEASYASRRLVICLANSRSLTRAVEHEMVEFVNDVNHMNLIEAMQLTLLTQHDGLDYYATEQGFGYSAQFHAVLYEVKAFLDLYVRLIGSIFEHPSCKAPPGFNFGKVEDSELAGGRFINWLLKVGSIGQDNALKKDTLALANLFLIASKGWLSAAINLRDTVGHFREVPQLNPIWLQIERNTPRSINLADIPQPSLQSGERIDKYAERIVFQLCELVFKTRSLLPRTDGADIGSIDECKRLFKWSHCSE